MLNTVSSPGRIGVQVATGFEVAGTVAVWGPVPTEMKAVAVPSFTTRRQLPTPGKAPDVDAAAVTAIFSVMSWAEKGMAFIQILALGFGTSFHISSKVTLWTLPTVIPRIGSTFFSSMIRSRITTAPVANPSPG